MVAYPVRRAAHPDRDGPWFGTEVPLTASGFTEKATVVSESGPPGQPGPGEPNGVLGEPNGVKDQVLVPEDDRPSVPRAMTVGGSDSGAGDGIQADLKTFAAHGVYGTSTVIAVTAQSTKGVYAIAEVPDEVIVAQIDMLLEDIGADAAKTGMLSSPLIVEVVADRLQAWGVPVVVDPAMTSKSGDSLLQPNAVGAMKRHLIPGSRLVSVDGHEASILTRRPVATEEERREAARRIHALGTGWVLIRSDHRDGLATDILFDGVTFLELASDRVATLNDHGDGSTLSAAITANLALELEVVPAVEAALAYVAGALRAGYAIGGGHSPVNHFFRVPELGPAAAEGTGRQHAPRDGRT